MNEYDVIYCPFMEVEIQSIGSELLENIGNFSLLVLLSINSRKSLEEISSAVCIDISVVIETADELSENQLLEKEKNNRYSVTTLGKKYIRIYKFIRKFRENKEKRYAINCYTCQLEEVEFESSFSCYRNDLIKAHICEDFILDDRLNGSENLIESPNFENTKEYMKNFFDLSKVSLTNDDFEYIYFRLKVIKKDGKFHKFYVAYEIPPESYMYDSNSYTPEYVLKAKLPIAQGRREYVIPSVDLNIGNALLIILDKSHELLNNSGESLARDLKYINELNLKEKIINMDCYGKRIFNGEISEVKISRKHIKLSRIAPFADESEYKKCKGNEHISCHYIERKDFYVGVNLDFSKLIQKEWNFNE